MNALLDFSDLPRYDTFAVEQIEPAIEQCLKTARAALLALEAPETPSTWAGISNTITEPLEQLSRAWGMVRHLHSVADTPALREAYNTLLVPVQTFWSDFGQNQILYEKYKTLANSGEYQTLSAARKRVIDNALRSFRLGGAELPVDKKARFSAVAQEQAKLSAKFSENVLDATNHYAHYVKSEEELLGLPADDLIAAKQAAQAAGQTGYKFTLQFPSYFPVLQNCSNRALRETLFRAAGARASDLLALYQGKPEWDNSAVMQAILQLRQEEATLLGYANYAQVSLVPKMAQSPEEVITFLQDLAARARPSAESDLKALRVFAQTELGLETLELWDIAYASEKMREKNYAFSEQEVKQYFPLPHVLRGLFQLVQTLFGVHIVADTAPVWYPDVQFFRIENEQGEKIAQFYLDLYARTSKRGGAWMDGARDRREVATPQGLRIQTPIAYLTCNFAPPLENKPALLMHDDVITLFHEFGHGLHHMLTRIGDAGVAGIDGVEWDAVELPSQFMENFCWEWQVLQTMTAHSETGMPLPRTLFEKMLKAKNFQSGLATLRQVVFSLFDMHLHFDFDAALGINDQANKKNDTHPSAQILALMRAINQRIHVLPAAPDSRMPHSFSHIFAGGYAAGYYSYKWAEVLSADAYSAFEEVGVLNAEMGAQYRNQILAVGGSRSALESFKAFRGRAPNIDALLRQSGLLT